MLKFLLLEVFVAFLLPSALIAAPYEDEVRMLPGLPQKPSFRQYSGYLAATKSRRLHYWFVESVNNPKKDPVAVWLNGGPGCSSLFGLLGENGPFRVREDGVTLETNPFSWNNVANVLYIESPAGVGFSYASDKNYVTDDDLTSLENYAAMRDFLRKFPEYQDNELFITGESYGGIYVPMLSVLLMEDPSVNLKGFAVGNGVSNDEMLGSSIIYFAYYHGLIGTTEWNSLLKQCCGGSENRCNFVRTAQYSKACEDEVLKVQAVTDGGSFDRYNLYGPCAYGVGSHQYNHDSMINWAFRSLPGQSKSRDSKWQRPLAEHSCNNNTAVTTYLNLPEVRLALHIPAQVQKWLNCVDGEYQEGWYTKIYNDTTPFYKKLFSGGIRGILYNGDVDMACNFLGDEWFADSLGRPVTEERRMWHYRDEKGLKQVAGFVKTFDILTYLTVRGSGHMVPTDRPRPALHVITNLVKNTPF
ncbi:lysosomal protective protein-like isoform X2 [Littorina saxatilis]|uniref:Carboxypeptidase n=1 Tax=Littorina saxatilis TaxID=31220 RepID=A0AAN9GGA1_9CAEN